jgi:hypothetical protein
MRRETRPVWTLLLLAGCADTSAPTIAADPSVMPGPAPLHRVDDAVDRNAECVACHEAIAAEWQGSLHRAAYTSPDFQSALRSEPLPFCRGCHAPEADPRAPEAELAALGVACVSCHLPGGDTVLSARPTDAPMPAPHPVLRAAKFAAADACARCHEFAFPDRRPVPEDMQTTVREHQASRHRDRSCAACHMPQVTDADGSTHRSHAFAGPRDAAQMRAAFVVDARRPSAGRVELSLDLQEDRIGHAFPTGDLLRRLVVAVAVEGPTRSTRPQRRYLARHWKHARLGKGPTVRTLDHDDRLGVGEDPRVVAFTLDPADAGLPVQWSVRYERVEAFVGPGEDGAKVTGGLDLFAGTLPPLPNDRADPTPPPEGPP